MLDIHAHLLPGLDDGAVNMTMSLAMLDAAAAAGVTRIIATPHMYRPKDPRPRYAARESLVAHAGALGIKIYVGCEFRVNVIAAIEPGEIGSYLIEGTDALLLELFPDALPVEWEAMVCELVERGIRPIIAHPERYQFIQKNIGIAEKMVRYGCELQLDAESILGGMFSGERRTFKKLLDSGMVNYIASDAHRPKDYERLAKVRRMIAGDWPAGGYLESALPHPRRAKPRRKLNKRG